MNFLTKSLDNSKGCKFSLIPPQWSGKSQRKLNSKLTILFIYIVILKIWPQVLEYNFPCSHTWIKSLNKLKDYLCEREKADYQHCSSTKSISISFNSNIIMIILYLIFNIMLGYFFFHVYSHHLQISVYVGDIISKQNIWAILPILLKNYCFLFGMKTSKYNCEKKNNSH